MRGAFIIRFSSCDGGGGAFVARPGAQLYPLAPAPEIAEPDLTKIATRFVALEK